MANPYEVIIEEQDTTVTVSETNYTVALDRPLDHMVVIEVVNTNVVVEEMTPIVIEIPMGPAGQPGISEADMTFARRVDFINDNLLYKGEATVGTGDSSPLWRIHKIVIGSDDDITETWASGVDTFTHRWTDRLTLVYA